MGGGGSFAAYPDRRPGAPSLSRSLIQGREAADTTRWNLVVSKQAGRNLRQLLVAEGRKRIVELSRFVEESLAWTAETEALTVFVPAVTLCPKSIH
jgi:hypothetical protein